MVSTQNENEAVFLHVQETLPTKKMLLMTKCVGSTECAEHISKPKNMLSYCRKNLRK